MKRRALILAVVVIAMAVPSVAGGVNENTTYSFSGVNADAYSIIGEMDTGSDEPWSGVGVWGGEQVWMQTGFEKVPKTRIEGGMADCVSFTPASGSEPAVFVGMELASESADFEAAKGLDGAAVSFEAQGEIRTWIGEMPWDAPEGEELPPDTVEQITATVVVEWTATGPAWRERYMSTTRTDEFFSIDRGNTLQRPAAAVGSIIGSDGTVYFDGEFLEAGIYDSRNGGHIKGMWPEY